MQSSVGQQNIQSFPQNSQYSQQPCQTTQMVQQPVQPCQTSQAIQQQGQNVQVPNYSGVNIQIFNPSVTPPGATSPVYNVNAPNYASNSANGCYPAGYYTNNWGTNPNPNQNGMNNSDVNSNNTSSTTNTTENKTTDKKTEKKEIVQLTDDYIRNLENYLNSQDKEVRLMGAKEVVARLDEDHSRKDDKALNALINKMLQDPSTSVRILAMSALDSRVVTGDALTVNLLQQMQNSKSGYGQDSLQASQILLKMSGQTVEKEVEVKNKTTKKTETKQEKTEK